MWLELLFSSLFAFTNTGMVCRSSNMCQRESELPFVIVSIFTHLRHERPRLSQNNTDGFTLPTARILEQHHGNVLLMGIGY